MRWPRQSWRPCGPPEVPGDPARLDVVGLDYNPHSEHAYRIGDRGDRVDEAQAEERQLGAAELVRQCHARFGRPLVFAETGAPAPVLHLRNLPSADPSADPLSQPTGRLVLP